MITKLGSPAARGKWCWTILSLVVFDPWVYFWSFPKEFQIFTRLSSKGRQVAEAIA